MALAGCLLANIVDGFDVLVVAFAGSAIMADWKLDPATLGLLFSAGLVGMMLGSLFIAPLADRYGRRKVSLLCMMLMSVGMLLSATAGGAEHLIAFRLLTGLGIGGVLATLNTVVAEISVPAHRNLTMAIFSAGYPLGSVLGGGIAIGLIASHGWQIVFLAGGALTTLVFLVNLAFLPEGEAPAARGDGQAGFVRSLFGAGLAKQTIGICAAFFLNMISFYFILNWTPKMTEYLGFSADVGNLTTVIINAGSLLGPLIFGILADRLGLLKVAKVYFLGFGVAIAAFGFIPAQVVALYGLALAVGLCMAGAMTSLYASAPLIFPRNVRAGGTGLAIGIGRLGGALGLALAGFALNLGVTRGLIYLLFSLPPLLVVLLLATRFLYSPQLAAKKGELA
jgi:MFS family permease